MKLDLRPMLRGETNRIEVDFRLDVQGAADVTFDSPAHIVGYVSSEGGYMRLMAEATLAYSGECARCLDAVHGTFCMPFERTVVTEGTLTAEQEENNIDEYVILDNGILDVDEMMEESLILSFPMRLLCSEDCKGLCPVCGKPLRESDCSCVKKERDPRWAVLEGLTFDDDES